MKKFYAILAASLVTGTAMAATPRTIANQKASFVPGIKEVVSSSRAALEAGVMGEDITLKPSKSSASGKEWTVRINNNAQRWCDVLIFGDEGFKYPFEELPQYWVTVYTYDDNNDKPTRIYFDCVWPAQAYLDHGLDDDWYLNLGTENEIFDWDKAAKEYGSLEAAEAPATIESVAKYMKDNNSAMFEFPYGSLPGFYGLFNMQLMGQNSCTYQGTSDYWLKEGTKVAGSNNINMEKAAYLAFDAFDPDVNDVSMTM